MFLSLNHENRRSLTVLRTVLGAVLVWSLIETPFELAACVSGVQSAALVFSKLLLVILIAGACSRASIAPFARLIALFVCGASVLAIVPALPSEFRYDPIGFALSTVECALKALTIAVLVSRDAGVRLWHDWQRS